MDEESGLARDYLEARIDRRTLIRRLLGAGLSASAAAAFVEALNPGTAAAAATLPGSQPASGAPASGGSPTTSLPIITKLHPNAGPLAGGNHVEIVGANFLGTTQVTFGTAKATIKSVSDSKISVHAPAGHGTVQVVVKTAAGSSSTSHLSKYRYLPLPVVTLVSPNTGSEGGGTGVVITGTSFVHIRSVTFGGTKGTVTSHSPTSIHVTSPAHSATSTAVIVDVVVTTLGGASATGTADHFTYQATPPTPSCSTCGTCAGCGSCSTCATCASCASCTSCASCAGCGGCGGCASPETTSSVRQAHRAGLRRPDDSLRDARSRPLSPLSRARSRGAGLRPTGTPKLPSA